MASLRSSASPRVRQRAHQHRHGEERLRDRIVQLTRQALPLLERRQPACLIVQARILDRDRGLVGECPRQLGVARAVAVRFVAVHEQEADEPTAHLERYQHESARVHQQRGQRRRSRLSERRGGRAVAPDVVDHERAAPSQFRGRGGPAAREPRRCDGVGGHRSPMVEDDQFVAVHDQDRRARTAQHALQLLQHDL